MYKEGCMKKRIAENFLYHIWDEQHLKTDIETVSGSKITILFQGKWNTDAGPDFINSIILLDGKKLQGNVEIHRHEYDWKAHNHHEDPNFNSVILHVVFAHDKNTKFTISENGSKIPILVLDDNLDQQIEKLWKQVKTESAKSNPNREKIDKLKQQMTKKAKILLNKHQKAA